MFWTNVKRIVRAGFVGFWRNGFVSFTSVFVMTVTLSVIALIIFVGAILGASLTELRGKVDINVYFLPDASEEDIFALQGQIEQLPETASVEYVSREQALTDFQERHAGDELTLQALEELDDNPLGAILNVKARETSQYESIATFLESDAALGSGNAAIIDRINYFQNKTAIDRLTRIIEASESLGLAITLIFAAMSIAITFNTIRLAIYSAREEISVMRLVGASTSYARGPFVVEGVLYGIIAGIITLLIFYPLTLWLGSSTERFFGNINVFAYYVANFGQLFLLIIGSGILLGATSSYLAVRRYLKI